MVSRVSSGSLPWCVLSTIFQEVDRWRIPIRQNLTFAPELPIIRLTWIKRAFAITAQVPRETETVKPFIQQINARLWANQGSEEIGIDYSIEGPFFRWIIGKLYIQVSILFSKYPPFSVNSSIYLCQVRDSEFLPPKNTHFSRITIRGAYCYPCVPTTIVTGEWICVLSISREQPPSMSTGNSKESVESQLYISSQLYFLPQLLAQLN